jgi:hypothetical protein
VTLPHWNRELNAASLAIRDTILWGSRLKERERHVRKTTGKSN